MVVDDLKKLDAYVRQGIRVRGVGRNVFRILYAILLGAGFFYLFRSTATGNHPGNGNAGGGIWSVVLPTLIPLAVIGLLWAYFYYVAGRNQKTDPLLTHPQTVSIKPQSIQVSMIDSEVTYKWSGIHDIGSDGNSLYLFITKGKAFLVPRRAFATPDAAETFLQTAIAYWKGEAPLNPSAIETETWPPPPQTLRP